MIRYVSFYTSPDTNDDRYKFLAASTKIDYIIKALLRENYDLEVISASYSVDKFLKSSNNHSDGFNTHFFSSLDTSKKILRPLNMFWMKLQLLNYIIFKCSKDDVLLVYHSLMYMNIIRLVKRLKKLKLILEIEEIYGDVAENKRISQREIDYFNIADAYIFSTELLNKKINVLNKPSVVIYGTYFCGAYSRQKHVDGKIHIVYAGTLDIRKGGAVAANLATELDENYHIHILGFGSEKDIKNIQELVNSINGSSKCTLTYDGVKYGEDYIRFIQACDIGLSTQNPDAKFNDTSFPSKVLSYMANGLRVVSIRIPAIENSAIGNCMYYYDKQEPAEIAKTIKQIDFNYEYDGRRIIDDLDKKFREDIKKVL